METSKGPILNIFQLYERVVFTRFISSYYNNCWFVYQREGVPGHRTHILCKDHHFKEKIAKFRILFRYT